MSCEPVGATEIAERLGVKRSTVEQWQRRGLLPAPRWSVGGRPAWNWPTIAAWAERTERVRYCDVCDEVTPLHIHARPGTRPTSDYRPSRSPR